VRGAVHQTNEKVERDDNHAGTLKRMWCASH